MTLFIYCCIQVYSNLQPLCVCLSYQGTMNIIDQISADHDIDVQLWADELVDRIRKPSEDVSLLYSMLISLSISL